MNNKEKEYEEVINWKVTFPKLLLHFGIYIIYVIGIFKIVPYVNNIPNEMQTFFLLGYMWSLVMTFRVVGVPSIDTKYILIKKTAVKK